MHKNWIMGTALLALAVTGCKQPMAPPTPTPSTTATAQLVKSVSTFELCEAKPLLGVFDVILPKKFDQSANKSHVNFKKDPAFKLRNPRSKPQGANDHDPPDNRPFDVYLHDTTFSSSEDGLILVRVLLDKTNGWEFSDKGGIGGVGQTNETPQGVLCGDNALADPDPGIDPGDPHAKDVKKIASFYISSKAVKDGTNVPFAIVLQLKGVVEDPVILDPAIHPWSDPIPLSF